MDEIKSLEKTTRELHRKLKAQLKGWGTVRDPWEDLDGEKREAYLRLLSKISLVEDLLEIHRFHE